MPGRRDDPDHRALSFSPLDPIVPLRLQGDAPILRAGSPSPWTLSQFWEWAGSNLLDNTIRAWLAEWHVATAIGMGLAGCRTAWDTVDLSTPSGVRVEVKSSAFVQTWRQRRPTAVTFSTRPARAWCAETGTYEELPKRHADVYVFALLTPVDRLPNPLNLDEWEFYVCSTARLNERADATKSLSLSRVQLICGRPHRHADLARALHRAAAAPSPQSARPGGGH